MLTKARVSSMPDKCRAASSTSPISKCTAVGSSAAPARAFTYERPGFLQDGCPYRALPSGQRTNHRRRTRVGLRYSPRTQLPRLTLRASELSAVLSWIVRTRMIKKLGERVDSSHMRHFDANTTGELGHRSGHGVQLQPITCLNILEHRRLAVSNGQTG